MGEALAPSTYASYKIKSSSNERRSPVDVALDEWLTEGGEWIKIQTGKHTIMLRKGKELTEFDLQTDKALGGKSHAATVTVYPRTEL